MTMNQTERALSALAYFSVFFLGFIFPAVLFFVTNHPEVRRHALAAFISHCIPVGFGIAVFIAFAGIGWMAVSSESPAALAGIFIVLGLFGLVSLIVVIWNVYKGVKLLMRQ
ncbi:hypothetical protein [Paenibacillus alkalitolerans]|uniref:hypothetical protein n=1 Tax=Paenibacillus alkalitolerans TaxID=2799335 RepID=UPI0018F5B954|nr:hypothetical protein [Paenibacillus alkalitolerans]